MSDKRQHNQTEIVPAFHNAFTSNVQAGAFSLLLSGGFAVSGGFPALRTFMKRLRVSNQNGAPRDTANIVISHPPRRYFARYQIQHQNPAVLWPGQSLYQSPCQPAT